MALVPSGSQQNIGCVHKGTNHVLKDVSDRDPLRDWDHDLNYVHSHAMQTPSQSRTGSAHCEVIFCSHCAVRADWPMHGFSVHFQNAHTQITFWKSFVFTCPRIRLSTRITIQNALFIAFQKGISKAWIKRVLRSQRVKSGFQSGKGRITFPNIFRNVIRSHVNRPHGISAFWFSTEHCWTALTPFWLSAEDVQTIQSVWGMRKVW